jgi:hypothetical protein
MTTTEPQPELAPVRAIKGFNPDLTCRGFRFAEGQTYEHDGEVRLCESGFHAVTEPIDVFGYYPPASSVYHEVEMGDVHAKDGSDSKIAGRIIKIGAKVELPALIKAQVDFVFARAGQPDASGSSTGYQGAASSTGYQGAASSTGYRGAASSTGYRGAASSTGYQGAASSTGYRGAASSTGDQGAASSTGYQGAASSTGDRGAALATGAAGGASATGSQSVAIVTGYSGRAKGALGCWLVLTERDDDLNILGVQALRVDGEQIKADTYYTLRGGAAVEE